MNSKAPFVRLGYLATIQSGITVDANREVGPHSVMLPYLRVANVQDGYVDLDSVSEITVHPSVAQSAMLKFGDVLMTEGGDLDKLGRGTVWKGQIQRCLHQNHVFAVRPDQRLLHPKYLALVTRTAYARSYFESTGTKTTNLASTSSAKIRDFRVPLPNMDIQIRIANFIDVETKKIDRIAAIRERMLELLTQKRERTADEVLGLGSSPPLIPLKYAVRSVNVGIVITPAKWYVDDGGVRALRGLNIKPGHIDPASIIQISKAGHLSNIKSRLSSGDVVVVRTGQAGAAAVVSDQFDGCNCIDLLIIRPGHLINSSFLAHYINSSHVRSQISRHSVGTIQSHFNVSSMRNLGVPAYAHSDQCSRVAILDAIIGDLNQLISRIKTQLTRLSERRDALINAAVTGQIDVTTGGAAA